MSKKDTSNDGGKIYDRIFRENAQFIFIPLIEMELDFRIIDYQPLQEKITKTIEREVDFLYKVTTDKEKELLLHLEFQTNNDVEMLYRMQEYHALLQRKYKLPIRHVVIYLGGSKARMRKELRQEEVFTGFDIIKLYELDAEKLLQQQVPEVLILALLSDYKKEQIEPILRSITRKLRRYSKSEQDRIRYLKQLLFISRLRNLHESVEKIFNDMPVYYDVYKDKLFLEGLEKGEAKGRIEGEAKGVIALFNLGFDVKTISKEMDLPIERVQVIIEKWKNK